MDWRYGLGWIVIGAVTYLGVWLSHDKGGVPDPGAGGNLPIKRPWVRSVLRHGDGPILLVSVLVQVFSVAAVLRGAVIAVGDRRLEGLSQAALFLSLLVIALGWTSLYLRFRRRSKSKAPSDIAGH
jgi:hypothetical protein